MVRDLDLDVRVEIVPTVREADGLAMSSRNAYLSAAQRAAAPTLQRALRELYAALERGDGKETAVRAAGALLDPAATLDYLDVVDADTFEPLERRAPARSSSAPRASARPVFIDNIWVPAMNGSRVLLGVSGGIAAYKAAALASTLVQRGAIVDVVHDRRGRALRHAR